MIESIFTDKTIQETKMIKVGLLILCVASLMLHATIPHENTIVLQSRYAGMFSIFQDVLSMLQLYEKGRFEGAKIDFGSTGIFYDDREETNWWTYYFEPIFLGNVQDNAKIYNNLESWRVEFCNSREYNHYLINKYIRLKPKMQAKIDSFTNHMFKKCFVLGVHYRGGDKVSISTAEASRVPYEEVAYTARNFLQKLQHQHYIIFIASDELDFIKYMKSEFPGKTIYYQEAHIPVMTNRTRGEVAIIDSILLSEVDFLIRTNSNLSLCSLFFNPSLSYLNLSDGFWHPVKKMRDRLDATLKNDSSNHEILSKALEYYLLNNGESILILGSPYFKDLFTDLLKETPQQVIQSSWDERVQGSRFPIDLIYIVSPGKEISDNEKSSFLLDQMITLCEEARLSKKALIVIKNEESSCFRELAMPYLLANGFQYFQGNPCILERNGKEV